MLLPIILGAALGGLFVLPPESSSAQFQPGGQRPGRNHLNRSPRRHTHATPIVLGVLLLGASTACHHPDRATNRRAPITGQDSADPGGPRETLAAYLAAFVFRTPAAMPDSLEWCPHPDPASEGGSDEGWEPDKYIAIANPRVLGIRGPGEDSVRQSQEVVAEVLRLAEVSRGASWWIAQIDITPDTLVWTLARRPSGAWGVCGPALSASGEGAASLPLFLVTEEFARRGEINSARWSRGASWDAVARVADSLRSRP
jgi:hypothetical protein